METNIENNYDRKKINIAPFIHFITKEYELSEIGDKLEEAIDWIASTKHEDNTDASTGHAAFLCMLKRLFKTMKIDNNN
jgi:hypothetical protein